jgi:hypothetical protein
MVSWQEFVERAPALARAGRERFDRHELVMLGTLRRNGWPRISPVEFLYFEDDLTTGGMWQSKKCLDLLRDPRCVLHSVTADKSGTQGDFKLYGRAVSIDDPATRSRYGQAVFAAIGWQPSEPFHLFRVDIEAAGFIVFGEEAATLKAEMAEGAGEALVRTVGGATAADGHLVVTWEA